MQNSSLFVRYTHIHSYHSEFHSAFNRFLIISHHFLAGFVICHFHFSCLFFLFVCLIFRWKSNFQFIVIFVVIFFTRLVSIYKSLSLTHILSLYLSVTLTQKKHTSTKQKTIHKSKPIKLIFVGNVPGRPQGGRHGMVFGQIPVSSITVPLVPGSTYKLYILFSVSLLFLSLSHSISISVCLFLLPFCFVLFLLPYFDLLLHFFVDFPLKFELLSINN